MQGYSCEARLTTPPYAMRHQARSHPTAEICGDTTGPIMAAPLQCQFEHRASTAARSDSSDANGWSKVDERLSRSTADRVIAHGKSRRTQNAATSKIDPATTNPDGR